MRYVLDEAVSEENTGNKLIDETYGTAYFSRVDGDYHRVCICRLKTGQWSLWRGGFVVETGDHLEELHLRALAHYLLTDSGEGFGEVEFN